MNVIFEYLIKSALVLSVLYFLYWLLLRKDTYFRFNRYVLLAILMISLLMPLIDFDSLSRPEPLSALPVIDLSMEEISVSPEIPVVIPEQHPFNWRYIAILIYGAGAFLILVRLITQGIYLYAVSRLSKVITAGRIKIVLMNADITPFAYFNKVYVPASKAGELSMSTILQHEQSHLQQMHYIDNLSLQILTIVQWFNPLVWMFERSLKEVHEYLADEAVLQQGHDQGTYQALLVNEAVGGPVFTITNQFNKSLIKNRIIMMTKMKTPKMAQLKAILFVPAFLFVVFAFASPATTIQPIIEKGQKILSNDTVKTETTRASKDSLKNEIIKKFNEDSVYITAFPGGAEALYNYTKNNTKYPEDARKKGIQGTVTVQFEIGIKGKVFNVKVLNTLDKECDDEAVRVVSSMPEWTVIKTTRGDFTKNYRSKGFQLLYNNSRSSGTIMAIRFGEPKQTNPGDGPYTFVEQMPEYPGGIDSLMSFIGRNLRYPVIANEQGISGRVILQFVVTKTGLVDKAKIIKGLGGGCDEEALRVIKMMPKWKPGYQKGEAVDVYFTLPVTFSLKERDKKEKSYDVKSE